MKPQLAMCACHDVPDSGTSSSSNDACIAVEGEEQMTEMAVVGGWDSTLHCVVP